MKIVYEGSDSPAHATEVHLAQSFEALGHHVTLVSPAYASSQALAYLVDQTEPDLFLLTRPWSCQPLVNDKLLERWRRRGIVTAGFHLDRFWGLPERERWVTERADPLFRCQHFFSTDGDHDADFANVGVNHHWLPPAVLASEAVDVPANPAWRGRWDVGFVGSAPTSRGGNYHPEYAHRHELVAWLEQTYGDRFVHVGNGGHLGNNFDRPNLRGGDLNAFYGSVPVIVGDSCFAQSSERYWSDRVPETWGRGGFLIHPYCSGLDALLGPYPSWQVGDWKQLRHAIDHYLAHPADRDAVRADIARVVRAEHTYTNRAAEILCTLGLTKSVIV